METEKKMGKIYKICDMNDTKRYIGSTIEPYLSNRMGGHRTAYKRWKQGKNARIRSYDIFEEFGIDNCQIVLIEEFDYVSRDHLRAKEAEYISRMDCANKNIPTRTKENWYEDHPQYNKNYYEQHKEAHLSIHKCQCGGKFSYFTKAKHQRSKRHTRYQENIQKLGVVSQEKNL